MPRLNSLLDYLLWPALFVGALIPTGFGIAHGHGPLAFNLTYLSLAGLLFWLEKVRPHEEAWRESDGQEVTDLAHTLFTKISVQVVIVSLTNLGIAHQFGDREAGGVWPAHWPMFLQVCLALVVAELGLYWAHRLAHEWMPLWKFHAVHHSSKKLWFFNTGRFHFVDTIKSMVFATPLLALAGAPGDVFIWGSAITAYIGVLTHCNIQMRFGWLSHIFNTPGLHRWHHSMDLREGNKNYGENLVLWDQIFGTYYDDSARRPPAEIGIREAMPKGFFGQLAAPFYWGRYQAQQKTKVLANSQAAGSPVEGQGGQGGTSDAQNSAPEALPMSEA
jgi:sterol desaturase/sphingolipid hydroxylase (fatty acid hydroxylase superfamily)